jgi:polysaccharide biosynthesis transport protein
MVSENGNNGNGLVVRTPPAGRVEHVVARPLSAPPREPEAGLPIAAVLNGLRRSWLLSVPIGILLGTLGGVAGWILMVPKYTASAYVQVNSADERLVFETADNTRQNASTFKLFKNTQRQMLFTPFVLNAALREEGVAALPELQEQPDPIAWIQGLLTIAYPGDGEIMNVSLQTPSGATSVKLVNSVVNAYMREVIGSEKEERLKRLNNLQRVHAEAESKVRSKRTELKSLAGALGTGDTDSLTVAQQSALQQFGWMQEKLSTVQFQLMQAEGELKIAQEMLAKREQALADSSANSAGSEILPEIEVFDITKFERPVYMIRLEQEITDVKNKLEGLTTVGDSHPSVRRLNGELTSKQMLLSKYQEEFELRAREEFRIRQMQPVARTTTVSGRPAYNPDYEMANLSMRVAVLKTQEKLLTEKVENLSAETRQLGKSSIDVELMRGEIAGLEEVLKRVSEEIQKTEIELQTSSRVKLISLAENATAPDAKKQIALTVALALFGLLFPSAALVGWDMTRKRVSDVDSLKGSLELANLGTIPRVHGDPLDWTISKARLHRADRDFLQLKESVDSLAAMLLHRTHEMGQRTFMFTSAMPGEGKSTVACQVASSLARCGKRVVLVDLDIRRPTIHKYMKLKRSPGVCELLLGKTPLSQAVQHVSASGLDVIVAGALPVRIQEQATRGTMDSLFDELRSTYDMIIIDACPVLPVVDARIIGKFADGTVLTLVRDVSRMPNSVQAYKMLQSFGVRVIGTVLIGAMPRGYSNYYYYASPNTDEDPALLNHSAHSE